MMTAQIKERSVQVKRKYAMILGNLGNTRDSFCSGYKKNPSTAEMLRQVQDIPLVEGIELVGTWDIDSHNATEMKKALADAGLQYISIIPGLFGDQAYWKGSYTSSDPAIRRKAVDWPAPNSCTTFYVSLTGNRSIRELARKGV